MINFIKMHWHKLWYKHHTEEYQMFRTIQATFVYRDYAFVMARALRKRAEHFDAWYALYNKSKQHQKK